jgi:hypothetical protein
VLLITGDRRGGFIVLCPLQKDKSLYNTPFYGRGVVASERRVEIEKGGEATAHERRTDEISTTSHERIMIKKISPSHQSVTTK